ncbi:alpha/beta fold hydrolase [Mycoplasma feriruminatoris]|uniref:Alpha/beta hydrolase n=1 Tax=Mycoplasma feriruminatoris TaxID=1179777 RepID=A0AAQ3DN19_9MOLU|nr:alpha/beta hydrolase [Mycoplasma feriruminatoris]WFQ95283.1 alpha/beta hydrolase [Mycoplasma feriruminatoris]
MSIIYDYEFVFKNNNNDKENIIFCHGFNSKLTALSAFSNYWTKSNYYALQFPGSNLIKPIKNHQVSVEQFADLLIEFINKNNLKNVILIGKSLGAGVVSLAYLKNPLLFKKLILITPINQTQLDLEFWKNDYVFINSFDDYLTKFVPYIYYNYDHLLTNQNWINNARLKFNLNYYTNQYIVNLAKSLTDSNLHNKITKAYQSINIPTLVVLAKNDRIIDCNTSLEFFNKTIKNVKIKVINNASHMVYKDQSEQLNQIIDDFITNN